MKDKDQKHLELLYESVVNRQFVFLKEEERFVKLCAEQIYELLDSVVVSEPINMTSLFEVLYWRINSPFKPQNPVYNIVPTLHLGTISRKFQVFYNTFVQNATLKSTYIGKQRENGKIGPGSLYNQAIIEFINPYDNFDAERIQFSNENRDRIIKLLEKYLKLNIEFTFTDKGSLHEINTGDPDWKEVYLWRTKKLDSESITQKLPELEGLI